MTDKVQKIRQKVARIQAYTQSDILKEVLDYIDKVQEDPKFKTGDHIKPIDSSLGAPRTILEVCDGWYVTNQGTLDFEFEDNWELVEEPISEDWIEELRTKLDSMSKEDFKKVFDKYAVDFNEEPVSEELEKVVEEIVNPTVLNAYGVKEIANRLRRTMIEPVSEELEEASEKFRWNIEESCYQNDNGTYTYSSDNIEEAFIAGVQWQKEKMMAKAIDVEVKFDAGGYPYIPQMELYDYDNDVPIAKEGDKYKVVLIKED